MSQAKRKWTPKEDALLQGLVNNELENSRPLLWRELAKHVPGRSNKDCRKRWWNSLAGGTAKGPWSQEEDKKLIEAVWAHGTNWNQVAGVVGSRCADQCSSHWSQVLSPDINHCDWTAEEDERLLQAVQVNGAKWSIIADSHTPQRTRLALKNRYSKLQLSQKNASSSTESRVRWTAKSPKQLNNKQLDGSRDNEGKEQAVEEEEDDDEDETGGEDEEEENGNGKMVNCMPELGHLSKDKSSGRPPEVSRELAPQGDVVSPNPPEIWMQHNGALITPGSTAEQWIDSVVDQTMDGNFGNQLCRSYGFFNPPAHGDIRDTGTFLEHNEDAMNLDFDFQGILFPEPETTNNSHSHPLGNHPAPIAPFADLGVAGLTPESLKDTEASSVKDGPTRETRDFGLHRVSINLSCTTEQLSKIMTSLTQLTSTVTFQIDTS